MSPLEELNLSLVLLRRFARSEGSQVSALAGLRIRFPGIKSVLTGFEFANHT